MVGAWSDCRLSDRTLEGFKGIAESCKCSRLVLEEVPQFVKVGKEASENVSVL